MREYRPGPATPPVTLGSFDPGCAAKSVLRQLKGLGDTFYVYRIKDVHGDRVAMYERRVEASTFQGNLELVGRFEGLCTALAAYRSEEARLARPSPSPAARRPQ